MSMIHGAAGAARRSDTPSHIRELAANRIRTEVAWGCTEGAEAARRPHSRSTGEKTRMARRAMARKPIDSVPSASAEDQAAVAAVGMGGQALGVRASGGEPLHDVEEAADMHWS